MDKLETFFIKTVATAQQQAQPTSGAVSTTKIGGFLAPETAVENILDKLARHANGGLASAPISRDASRETPTTEQVIPAESPKPKPDEQLLSELTEPAEPLGTKPVVKDEKVKTEPVEPQGPQQEQVKKSILDQLTGRRRPQNEDSEQTDKSQAGDSGDA
jgi:hypothetical protein